MSQTPPPFHVVASDMDGTLLDADHTVTPFTKATIQAMIAKYHQREASGTGGSGANDRFGVFFVLASGRHVHDLSYILENLELPDYSGYIVSSNGARAHCIVHDEDKKGAGKASWSLKEVFSSSLLPSQAYRLLGLVPADEEEININLYRDDGWHCSLDWRDELQYFKSGFAYTMYKPSNLRAEYEAFLASHGKTRDAAGGWADGGDEALDDDPANPLAGIAKMYFGTDNTARLGELHRTVTGAAEGVKPFRVTATFSSRYCMELTAEGVTKVSGINVILPYLQERSGPAVAGEAPWHVSKTCVAFGDGENDEVMLRSAAKGCMMANRADSLHTRLAGVPTVETIGANTEDGVAKKIIEIFDLTDVKAPS